LLGILAARAGRTVSTEHLLGALWPLALPETARSSLQAHISRLRSALGADRIVTESRGYRLVAEVDSEEFERAFQQSREALLDGLYAEAELGLRSALDLWRGPAYDGMQHEDAVSAEAQRLEELRLTSEEDLVEARLQQGAHDELVADLRGLVGLHPLRERMWGQLILALYRSGRQAEALAAYREVHALLADELGVQPNPWLRRLHDAVLRQDAALELAPGPAALRAAARPAPAPDISYARNGEVSLAYQVTGDGPSTLLYLPSYLSHLELNREWPAYASFLDGLAGIGRLVVMDKRGMGLSDRLPPAPSGERVADVLAVLDATGTDRALVVGSSEGAAIGLELAVGHPDRVSGLVLFGAAPTVNRDSYQIGTPRERYEQTLGEAHLRWGTGRSLERFGPSAYGDAAATAWYGRLERHAVSPGGLMQLMQWAIELDYRDLLPEVALPTLVLHRSADVVPIAGARYLAEHIPGARFQELPGCDHLVWFGDAAAVVDAVAAFAAQILPAAATTS
jgi:pimeloyl-ACP methyl ester carboxylesterase/DNA-binding SARP family transcriptional activator